MHKHRLGAVAEQGGKREACQGKQEVQNLLFESDICELISKVAVSVLLKAPFLDASFCEVRFTSACQILAMLPTGLGVGSEINPSV